ncbi:MAG TPA: Fe(2+)-trafficking protein, partial [Myxococcota bacterium]|nr:Fe(2+)-trafficking protein [Myxococcota bacterium]
LKGPIGKIIKQHISADAWQDWIEVQIKIINEERLDLSDITSQKRLFNGMLEYLGLSDLVNRDT